MYGRFREDWEREQAGATGMPPYQGEANGARIKPSLYQHPLSSVNFHYYKWKIILFRNSVKPLFEE